jgi:uncharacterized LabA/DUF88 family protein
MAASNDDARVVVFIDGQNLLNDARRAFCTRPFGPDAGQVNPMSLGRLLVSRQPVGSTRGRKLREVRIYRGRPDPRREPQTYSAHMRQCAAWEAAGATVITRPLRYPRNWPKERAEEKGIDVQIAIDMLMMAVRSELDVAVLVTTDTDLRPALEAFHALPAEQSATIEVAAWRSPTCSKKLQVPGLHVWSHFLEVADYEALHDSTDYNRP